MLELRFNVKKKKHLHTHSAHYTTESILLARAAPVHDFSSVVSRQLAESIVAVNDRPLHDLCISQQETGFCNKTDKYSSRKQN